MQTSRDRRNLHKILEREDEFAVNGEKLAQQRLYEAEADVEIKHSEERELFVRLIRSWSPNDYSYNRRINGLIRLNETRQACIENWKWGKDSFEDIKQKIAKKLKNWGELFAEKQIERDKQVFHELSLQQQRSPTTVSQFLTQIHDLPNKVNSLSKAKEFLRSWNSEQLWSGPRSRSTLYCSEYQNSALSRFWIAAQYTE